MDPKRDGPEASYQVRITLRRNHPEVPTPTVEQVETLVEAALTRYGNAKARAERTDK